MNYMPEPKYLDNLYILSETEEQECYPTVKTAEPKRSPLCPNVPPKINRFFDLEKLCELCGEHEDLLMDITKDFSGAALDYLAEIQMAIAEANESILMEQAVSLRGTAAVCCVRFVPGMCRSLEFCAKKGNFQAAQKIFETLYSHIHELEEVKGLYHSFCRLRK